MSSEFAFVVWLGRVCGRGHQLGVRASLVLCCGSAGPCCSGHDTGDQDAERGRRPEIRVDQWLTAKSLPRHQCEQACEARGADEHQPHPHEFRAQQRQPGGQQRQHQCQQRQRLQRVQAEEVRDAQVTAGGAPAEEGYCRAAVGYADAVRPERDGLEARAAA